MESVLVLEEICSLNFHWHDISRFKYFDLEQIAVPELPPEDATVKVPTKVPLASISTCCV